MDILKGLKMQKTIAVLVVFLSMLYYPLASFY